MPHLPIAARTEIANSASGKMAKLTALLPCELQFLAMALMLIVCINMSANKMRYAQKNVSS